MNERNNRGRPATKYDESELYAIINHYRENIKPQGDIKYLQVYRYHLELHKERPDICSRTYSEDFWRKNNQPGRIVIDTANEIRTVTLKDDYDNKKDIPNVSDIVNKFINDPERLIKHLQPLENEVRRSIQRERDLKQKNEELKDQIKQEREEKKSLRNEVGHLKECIFKLFHYSDKDGIPLENLLDLNNKNKRIKMALDEAFRKPHDFYTELTSYKQHESSKNIDIKDNVVPLTNARRSLADDYEGKF